MYSSFVLFVLFVQIFSIYGDKVKCPFNKECTCSYFFSVPLTYDSVECNIKDGKLPKFDIASKGKYRIQHEFVINSADLRVIPAKHFAAFEYIGNLHLNHKSAGPWESAEINWDDSAFDGVQIKAIHTVALDGLIPVPGALKNSDLRNLQVESGRTPISLKNDSFKNLPSLELITIYKTTVHEIQPNAFSGLEDNFEVLSLMKTDIRGPISLKDPLKNMNKLNFLYLSNNWLTKVKDDSFPELVALTELHLSGNPIENVDRKGFATLKNLRKVYLDDDKTLTLVDLATFSDKDKDVFSVTFIADKSLKSIIVSDAGEFAKKTKFDFAITGVETVDRKVADLIDKYPDMFIYFEDNYYLKCEGLEWMSKIDCPARMWIDNSRCADKQGQKLTDYLKSVDPESKCKEISNLPLLLQIGVHLARQHQNWRPSPI